MKLRYHNVNLNSTSGPNSFATKLHKYMVKIGWSFGSFDPDAYLCFIESQWPQFDRPMIQRLDGIYFNSKFNYESQNKRIKRTYEIANGVVFQSSFNKDLTFKYFGECDNYTIIHNGADLETIETVKPLEFNKYENLWACASSWRPHKRLQDNINYFLEHAGENDGLIIAGAVKTPDRIKHPRIHYAGMLHQKQLYSLYKKAKYFIHLAWLDHCPNVVVDARACGCHIICSSAGGTREIAGPNSTIILEDEWDFEPVRLYEPPKINFNKKLDTSNETCYNNIDMTFVAKKYANYIENIISEFS